jgi:hypothetical protein
LVYLFLFYSMNLHEIMYSMNFIINLFSLQVHLCWWLTWWCFYTKSIKFVIIILFRDSWVCRFFLIKSWWLVPVEV